MHTAGVCQLHNSDGAVATFHPEGLDVVVVMQSSQVYRREQLTPVAQTERLSCFIDTQLEQSEHIPSGNVEHLAICNTHKAFITELKYILQAAQCHG